MPHSLEWVLAHADELAEEAEAFDPTGAERLDLDEYLLSRAARARALAERQVADAVREARRHDVPWRKIGKSLGVSPQSAQRRYSVVVNDGKSSTAKRSAAASPSRWVRAGDAALVAAALHATPRRAAAKKVAAKRAPSAKKVTARKTAAKRTAARRRTA